MNTPIDRLSALLERFRVRSHLFHAGELCGVTHFAAQEGRGFLHVLRRGEMVVTHRARSGGARHPLVRALPPLLVLPLRQVEGLDQTLALLFAETTQLRCGSRILADRLFEVLILQLLRWLLDHPEQGDLPPGLLTGLGEPRIAAALTALHEAPGADWPLAAMAQVAGMSRSAFAAAFKLHTGCTPADYLAQWRITIAQDLLRKGMPVKVAAGQLGYQSAASLSRAFTMVTGCSPRAWLQTVA
jgi:AraC-like DNA-binding protein